MGQEFIQPIDTVRRDAQEDVAEPGKRLDARPLAGSDEASQQRCRLAPTVAVNECPVAAAQRDVAIGPSALVPYRTASQTFRSALVQRFAPSTRLLSGWPVFAR